MAEWWEPCPCGKAWSFTNCLIEDNEDLPDGLYCKVLLSYLPAAEDTEAA